MADPFRYVRPGDPLSISAAQANAWTDAAKAERERQPRTAAGLPTFSRDGCIVRVLNNTGADLPRASVVGLGTPIFAPGDYLDSFLSEVTFRAIVPTDDPGLFAVMIEPVDANRIARALIAGVVQVRVRVTDADATCADVDAGSTSALVTTGDGTAQILWLDAGEAYGYGDDERWAIIRFGTACGGSGASTVQSCCNEPPYEVLVACGDCEGDYGEPVLMPRFWVVRVLGAGPGCPPPGPDDEGPCADPCAECEELQGQCITIEHRGGCVWDGRNADDYAAELRFDGTKWVLTVTHPTSACAVIVGQKSRANFSCCGPNPNWIQSTFAVCTGDLVITPHPCTCCDHVRTCGQGDGGAVPYA